jgi:hypothetical protein
MHKNEIGWTLRLEDGTKISAYAQHRGDQWLIFHQAKRFENWEPIKEPPLEDWLELLDAVRRRIARNMLQPEEEGRLLKRIRQEFPAAKVE